MVVSNSKQKKTLAILLLMSLLVGAYFLFTWWSNQNIVTPPPATATLLHFSDVFRVADSTRDYAKGAIYITDIEANPNFKKLFFNGNVSLPTDETILHELQKVKEFSQFKTASTAQQVFNTSYYIGNYEVLPEKTLQSWLFSAERPVTTKLLETALADVRAGVAIVQDVYDVAPPYLYEPISTTSLVYFETPSFPSLTMSEAAITALLMARIDEKRARFYELSAREYAHAIYASGAHFESDIEAALALAEVYFTEMERDDRYQALFSAAALEWSDAQYTVPEIVTLGTRPLFTFSYFPAKTNVDFREVTNYGYHVSYPEAEIDGALRLSLIDTRLPNQGMRLYEYELHAASSTQVVPIALDLQQGSVGKRREVLAFAEYDTEQPDSFLFLTGKTGSNGSLFVPGSASLQKVLKNEVVSVLEAGSLLDHVVSRDQILYTATNLFIQGTRTEHGSDIIKVPLSVVNTEPSIIATGTSPVAILDSILLFVGDNAVVQGRRTETNEPVLVEGFIPSTRPNTLRKLRSFEEQKIIVVTDSWVSEDLVPHSEVVLYTVSQARDTITAEPRYQFVGNDILVSSIMLSPGGRYIAFSATEALGDRMSKVLIFDTFDGIIKKEVDLQPFSAAAVSIDDWITK